MLLGTCVSKSPQPTICFSQSAIEIATLEIEAGLLIRRSKRRSRALAALERKYQCADENDYGQVLPLTMASAMFAEPATGDPISTRNIVNVLVPCLASISPRKIFPN